MLFDEFDSKSSTGYGHLPDYESEESGSPPFRTFSATTSGIVCASGGALLGTSIAGPFGGIVGAVAGAATGFFIGGFKK